MVQPLKLSSEELMGVASEAQRSPGAAGLKTIGGFEPAGAANRAFRELGVEEHRQPHRALRELRRQRRASGFDFLSEGLSIETEGDLDRSTDDARAKQSLQPARRQGVGQRGETFDERASDS